MYHVQRGDLKYRSASPNAFPSLQDAARYLGGEVCGGQIVCPGPSHSRRDRSLSVRFDPKAPGGFLVNSFSGDDPRECRDYVRGRLGLDAPPPIDAELLPVKAKLKIEAAAAGNDEHTQLRKALWLWGRSQPVRGTIVERYLASREIRLTAMPATLRFLPPQKAGQHPAMIAAFGLPAEPAPGRLQIELGNIRGVHLTMLRPDGSGKAGVEPNKITLGPSAGAPIVLAPPGDGLALAICEGVEDALSAHLATGWGAWAAGCASRLPRLATIVPTHVECVTLLEDDDDAGRRNVNELARALAKRDDLEVRVVRRPR